MQPIHSRHRALAARKQKMADTAPLIHHSGVQRTSSESHGNNLDLLLHWTNADCSRRLDSLENELEQMRQELNNRQATPSITSPSVLGSAPRDGISNMASADAENSELAMPKPHSISTEMIDTVELSPNVTSRLIEE